MRFLAIIPFLCAVAALTLSLLCLFAGSKPGYMENADLLTLNTSMLGQPELNTSSSTLINSIENKVKGDLNQVVKDVASEFGLKDFYSAHLLDYCEGFYTPSPVANATVKPSKNVSRCSNHTALFHFDPTAILQSELKPGVNLDDLKWPSAIQDAIHTVEVASKVMFVLYCVGVGFAGVAVLGAIAGIILGGRLSALLNFMFDILAFLALGIASAIATVITVKVVNAVNSHGKDIGVAASKGGKFLAMTWIATALMLLAAIVWIVECVAGRRKQVTYMKEGKTGRL